MPYHAVEIVNSADVLEAERAGEERREEVVAQHGHAASEEAHALRE